MYDALLPWLVRDPDLRAALGGIPFRAGAGLLTALLVALLLGRRLIPALLRRKVQEHTGKTASLKLADLHEHKQQTPTMGGLILIGAYLAALLVWGRWASLLPWLSLATMLALGTIGFADDWIKLTDAKKSGLSARRKLGAVALVGAAVGGYLVWSWQQHPELFRLGLPGTWYRLDLPVWAAAALIMAVVTATANAVNLSDGLDGLAAGAALPVLATLGAVAYCLGRPVLAAGWLELDAAPPDVEEAAVLAALTAGAVMGFLWFNAHPARIFMGDTGSLALGGQLALLAVFARQELLLPLAGGLFVLEALSVILQVGSFKLRGGKRLFAIAPLHHHFQFNGWPENRVVVRFWLVALLCNLLAIAALRFRVG